MISQALRIHESTVARHLSDYALSEKLKPENSSSQSRLSAKQSKPCSLSNIWMRTRTVTPTKLSLIYRLSLISVIHEQVAKSSRFLI
jgi:hypothetical protein